MVDETRNPAVSISRRRAILYGFVVVGMIVLALEILARVIWAYTFAVPASTQGGAAEVGKEHEPPREAPLSQTADYSKDIPYHFRRNTSAQMADTFVHTNNLGFRGTRPTLRKKPGQFRIVCVGDSVTFGYNVTSDEKAYPAVLHRLFEKHEQEIEVINAGRPGFESRHVAAFLEQVILGIDGNEATGSLEPDLLLVECGWNDARQFAPEPEPRSPSVGERLAGWSYLVRLPVRFLEAARAGDPEAEERAAWALIDRVRNGPALRNREAERAYRQSIERMVEVCQANGVAIVLVAPPNFLETKLDKSAWRKCASHFAKYPTLSFEGWQTMVRSMIEANREVAAERGVPFLDTSSLADATLFADICHPTDEGNERMASLIYHELLKRKLVPLAHAGQ